MYLKRRCSSVGSHPGTLKEDMSACREMSEKCRRPSRQTCQGSSATKRRPPGQNGLPVLVSHRSGDGGVKLSGISKQPPLAQMLYGPKLACRAMETPRTTAVSGWRSIAFWHRISPGRLRWMRSARVLVMTGQKMCEEPQKYLSIRIAVKSCSTKCHLAANSGSLEPPAY